MSSSLTTTLRLNATYNSQVPSASGTLSDQFGPINLNVSIPNGTGVGQADTPFRDQQTLTGSSHTYVWSTLPGTPTFARLRMVVVQVISAIGSGGTLSIAPGGTHPFPSLVAPDLTPGSIFVASWPDTTGAPAGSGATDQTTFTVTGTLEYILMAVGCST